MGALFLQTKKIFFKKIVYLRNHGQSKKYIHNYVGFNARLDTIQAAVLLVKLNNIKKLLNLRKLKAKQLFFWT